MKTQLPKFEGEQPKAARLKISGRSDERVGAMARNEEFYIVARCAVAKIIHGDDGGVLTRTHDAKAAVIVVIDRATGARLLDEAVMLANDRFGIRDLFTANPPEEPPSAAEG